MGSKDAEVMKEGIIMKKLMTLALAAAMMMGVATGANAIDFKAKGQWIMDFNYGMHGDFAKSKAAGNSGFSRNGNHEDEFEATQRVRLQLDAVASEALSGTVFFEIGDQLWGQNETGGALGADNNSVVELKRAYIDWMVPQTDLKVRMGIQGLALPSFTTNASQIIDDDVAAITLNYQFNENVGLTAFWARPYNDNYGYTKHVAGAEPYDHYMDNMDMFAVLLPLSFDGVKVTPWVMYAAMGPGMFGDGKYGSAWSRASTGMVSGFQGTDWNDSYGNAFWAGITGEVTYWDPFRIAWDFSYGNVTYDDGSLNRSGWLAGLLLEYNLDWTKLGLFGWYSSGDDDNVGNGSERLPTVSNDYGPCSFSGTFMGPDINGLERDRVIGNNLVGTWGVGFRLKDMSFLEDLKHTFHISLLGGTNDPGILKKYHERTGEWMAPNNPEGTTKVGRENLYLTTRDYALEFGLLNEYKIYDNLQVNLEASYIALWLDKSDDVWGQSLTGGDHRDIRDAWNVSVLFIYSF
mgnify:CR=1 FL=1